MNALSIDILSIDTLFLIVTFYRTIPVPRHITLTIWIWMMFLRYTSYQRSSFINFFLKKISKQEINEAFQLLHPEIMSEMTFSKIKSVKLHLLNIAKVLDLELSSLSHAFVYFEKLLQKNIITKQNRKLIAGN